MKGEGERWEVRAMARVKGEGEGLRRLDYVPMAQRGLTRVPQVHLSVSDVDQHMTRVRGERQRRERLVLPHDDLPACLDGRLTSCPVSAPAHVHVHVHTSMCTACTI